MLPIWHKTANDHNSFIWRSVFCKSMMGSLCRMGVCASGVNEQSKAVCVCTYMHVTVATFVRKNTVCVRVCARVHI